MSTSRYLIGYFLPTRNPLRLGTTVGQTTRTLSGRRIPGPDDPGDKPGPNAHMEARRTAVLQGKETGADAGNRTPDPIITSDVLCQLSYVGPRKQA